MIHLTELLAFFMECNSGWLAFEGDPIKLFKRKRKNID